MPLRASRPDFLPRPEAPDPGLGLLGALLANLQRRPPIMGSPGMVVTPRLAPALSLLASMTRDTRLPMLMTPHVQRGPWMSPTQLTAFGGSKSELPRAMSGPSSLSSLLGIPSNSETLHYLQLLHLLLGGGGGAP